MEVSYSNNYTDTDILLQYTNEKEYPYLIICIKDKVIFKYNDSYFDLSDRKYIFLYTK